MVSGKGDAVQPPKPCGYVKAGHIKVTPKSCGYINEENKECQVKVAPKGAGRDRLKWHQCSADR